MECDSASLTGTAHSREAEPSQDCAIHGGTNTVGWGIVCDGCSSGGRTDFGARLWALSIEADLAHKSSKLVAAMTTGEGLGLSLAEIAPRSPVGLEWIDLLTTAVIVCATKDAIWAAIAGDGVAVGVYEDGSLDVIEHRFTKNTPFYPEYLRVDQAMRSFISSSRTTGQRMAVERTRVSGQGEILDQSTIVVPIDTNQEFAGSSYVISPLSPAGGAARLVGVLAFSDGVSSRPKGSMLHTLRELCSPRHWKNSFLRRRLSVVSKEWARTESLPRDDLSIAGLWWPREPVA